MNFTYNDGGRMASGYKGKAGDCVVRAIAIATGIDYDTVYNDLFELTKEFGKTKRSSVAKRCRKDSSPRNGVFREIYGPYLERLGWKWVSTMGIGTGCTVHLKEDELPKGRLIVKVTKHLTAVIDGTIHDTHDPSRNETRCVYGYFIKE